MRTTSHMRLLTAAGPEEACGALAEVIPDIVMGSMGESKFDQVGSYSKPYSLRMRGQLVCLANGSWGGL